MQYFVVFFCFLVFVFAFFNIITMHSKYCYFMDKKGKQTKRQKGYIISRFVDHNVTLKSGSPSVDISVRIVINSNMTSFIGYVNNTIIKLTIYFNSHMRIDEHITIIIP